MKLTPSTMISTRPDILRAKHIYGVWFGAALGLTFAIFAWGVDAYQLNQLNGLHPWLKFAAGAILCMIVGGLTGGLAAKLDKPIFALLLWAIAASIFAWLIVSLPLQILPRLMGVVEPDVKDLLHYTYYPEFSSRVGVAYAWLVIFMSIAGLLQIPLSESAVFATSALGKVSPMLITLVLMGICGTIVDGLNNELLRLPIGTVNKTVQFSIDHRGKQIDPLESRKMHMAAFRTIQDEITPTRKFIISGYDQFLEQVQVLAQFERAWVECTVIYNQLNMCHKVRSIP